MGLWNTGRTRARLAIFACLLGWQIALAGSNASVESAGNVTPERLLDANAEPGAWLTAGRDQYQTYYSPLTGINPQNISRLGYAWSFDIEFTTAFEATPIVLDGVMFTSGNRGNVYSLDAKSGRLLWKFEPDIDPDVLTKLCCTDINRGVAVWRGKVYVGSLDGYLYALDAATGAVVWKVDTIADRSRAYSITGAPYIAKELVVIGNSGAEFDARGYVTAYDAATGKQEWRFYTVPGDPKGGFEHPELQWAAKTWDPNSRWDIGLGGTVWDGMAFDPKLNLLYIGTGNGTPWSRNIRSPAGGDNLFLASILALNPDTGRMVWFYQTTPRENWDYTATQKLILANLQIGERERKVIMQAPKNGFFYVLDRESGELLSANAYTRVTWASHVDLETGRPQETGQGDYSEVPKLVFPGPFGGHQWQPMSYSARTGLVYIPVQEIPLVYANPQQAFTYEKGRTNMGATVSGFTAGGWMSKTAAEGLPPLGDLTANQPDPRPRLFLRAWNPREGRTIWEVDITGDMDPALEFYRRAGGVMSTASDLVFQGGPDGFLRAYDAVTGAELNRIDVGTSMLAAPMTYQVDGEQYVAIMAGVGAYDGYVDQKYGKLGRIVAFRLGGGEVPKRTPVTPTRDVSAPPPIKDDGTAEQVSRGRTLFERHCATCHSTNRAPDLTRMSAETQAEFSDILLKGTRFARGMGNFSGVLSGQDVSDVFDYINHQQWLEYDRKQSGEASTTAPR